MRILVIGLALLVSGCASAPPVVISEQPQVVLPPSPDGVIIPNIHWTVTKDQTGTYYSLKYEDLEKLMNALNDVRVWIEKKNAEVDFYKNVLNQPTKVEPESKK